MSQDNHITLRGFLVADPTLRQKTAESTPLTEMRIGSAPRRLNRETGEWFDGPMSFYRVKCWRRLAVNAASSLRKGDMVVIRGKFYMVRWTDSEQKPRSMLEIEADSIGHDLNFGWTNFLRGTARQPHQAEAAASEATRPEGALPPEPYGDEEYRAVDDAGESREAVTTSGDQAGHGAESVAESDGSGGLAPGDDRAAADLTDGADRAERVPVPF